MFDLLKRAYAHPLWPLLMASVATVIFWVGMGAVAPVAATLLTMVAWAVNIRWAFQRRGQRANRP